MTAFRFFSPRTLRVFAIAAVVSTASLSGGCYGSFGMTRAIYRGNGRITGSTILNSIVMIVLIIIPVYQISLIVDIIILNSVEFWTGETLDTSKVQELPDGSKMVLAPGATADEAILTVTKDDVVTMRRTYRRVSPTRTLILDETGTMISVVDRTDDGGLTILAEGGKTRLDYSSEELASLGSEVTR